MGVMNSWQNQGPISCISGELGRDEVHSVVLHMMVLHIIVNLGTAPDWPEPVFLCNLGFQ